MNNEKPTGEKQTENTKILLNRVRKVITTAKKTTRSARPVRSIVKMQSIRPKVVGMIFDKEEAKEV